MASTASESRRMPRALASFLIFLASAWTGGITLGNAVLGPFRTDPVEEASRPALVRELKWYVEIPGTQTRPLMDLARSDRVGEALVRRFDTKYAVLVGPTSAMLVARRRDLASTEPAELHAGRLTPAPPDLVQAAELHARSVPEMAGRELMSIQLDQNLVPSAPAGLLALIVSLLALVATARALRPPPEPWSQAAALSVRPPLRTGAALAVLCGVVGGGVAWALLPPLSAAIAAATMALAGLMVLLAARECRYSLTDSHLLVQEPGRRAARDLSAVKWLYLEDRLDGVRRVGVVRDGQGALDLDLPEEGGAAFWDELCRRAPQAAVGHRPWMEAVFVRDPASWASVAAESRRD